MVDTFARQRQLVGTTAEWAANDLVVGYGEFAIELVSPGRMRAKIGDGVSVFSALAYFDPSVTAYVSKAGDTMSGPLVVPELDVSGLATFTGTADLGAGGVVAEPADNDNTQRVPSTHWVQSRVSGIITGLKLLGTWNATTNSPTLTSGVGTRGDFYMCSIAGTTPLDGTTTWAAGDSVVFNGVAWQKVPQNLNAAQIVAGLGYTPVNKAGDTMTGPLNGTVATFTTGLTVGTSGVEGYVHINEGGPSNAGYLAFHKMDGTRIGYIGFSNDRITYTAEMAGAVHEFAGPVKVPTPAAASDDTNAATTAWVRARVAAATPPPSGWQTVATFDLAAPQATIISEGWLAAGWKDIKIVGRLVPTTNGATPAIQFRKGGATLADASYSHVTAYLFQGSQGGGNTTSGDTAGGQSGFTFINTMLADGAGRGGAAIEMTIPGVAYAGHMRIFATSIYDTSGGLADLYRSVGAKYSNLANLPIDGIIFTMPGNFAVGTRLTVLGLK